MKCLPGEILSRILIDDNSCWNFIGGRSGSGYGIISLGMSGKQRGAHIIAYEMFKGPVLKGTMVLHTCDNPPCCNPDHLFLGDHQSNKDDEISKNRHVHGETHGCCKLTESSIVSIRQLLDAGCSQSQLAKQFGVTRQAIHRIKNRQVWGWLHG